MFPLLALVGSLDGSCRYFELGIDVTFNSIRECIEADLPSFTVVQFLHGRELTAGSTLQLKVQFVRSESPVKAIDSPERELVTVELGTFSDTQCYILGQAAEALCSMGELETEHIDRLMSLFKSRPHQNWFLRVTLGRCCNLEAGLRSVQKRLRAVSRGCDWFQHLGTLSELAIRSDIFHSLRSSDRARITEIAAVTLAGICAYPFPPPGQFGIAFSCVCLLERFGDSSCVRYLQRLLQDNTLQARATFHAASLKNKVATLAQQDFYPQDEVGQALMSLAPRIGSQADADLDSEKSLWASRERIFFWAY